MSMAAAVGSVLSQYAGFQGRARRSELWWWVLTYFLVYLALSLVDDALGTRDLLPGLGSLALIVPTLAVLARRLHDIGRSGWWQVLFLVPLVGTVLFVLWGVTDSEGDNVYGPRPGSPPGSAPGSARSAGPGR